MTFRKEQTKSVLIDFLSVPWHSPLKQRCESLCVNHSVPVGEQTWEREFGKNKGAQRKWCGVENRWQTQ